MGGSFGGPGAKAMQDTQSRDLDPIYNTYNQPAPIIDATPVRIYFECTFINVSRWLAGSSL